MRAVLDLMVRWRPLCGSYCFAHGKPTLMDAGVRPLVDNNRSPSSHPLVGMMPGYLSGPSNEVLLGSRMVFVRISSAKPEEELHWKAHWKVHVIIPLKDCQGFRMKAYSATRIMPARAPGLQNSIMSTSHSPTLPTV